MTIESMVGVGVPTFRPEALAGTCSNGDPDAVCALMVNTTLYDPLILELGAPWEQLVSRGTQWFTFILSVFMSMWFVYNMFTGHCGWEVIFVTVIECEFPRPIKQLGSSATASAPAPRRFCVNIADWPLFRVFKVSMALDYRFCP